MKFALIAALLITLPALAALVYGLIYGNFLLVAAAAASFLLNSLPFLAAGFLLRGRDSDLGH